MKTKISKLIIAGMFSLFIILNVNMTTYAAQVSTINSVKSVLNKGIVVNAIKTKPAISIVLSDKVQESEPVLDASESLYLTGSGLTRNSGVNYYDGWRETYYSSNVLYHYRTGEWTPDSNGVYRDSNGYVVVASSSDAQGSIVSTSFGPGKVYDTGCAVGTHDIYTNW